MIAQGTRIAELDRSRLGKLKKLEQELGKVIVAVEPQYQFARLSDQQLARLQKAEREIGAVLLAYDKG